MSKLKCIFPQYLMVFLLQLFIAAWGMEVYAQNNAVRASRIDHFAQELVDRKQIAGVTILLIKDGKPIYNKAFGYADVEQKLPMRNDHIFRIASQTKAITSLAAMLLFEEGKFLLDDPVSKYIPEFKTTRVLDKFNPADSSYTTVPAVREITIRDLFRHTSGITYPVFSGKLNLMAIYAKAGVATGIGSKGNLNDKITLLAQQPLLHQPGTAFTYGLNTDVLGRLVEIWSGIPLDKFFQQRIFEPLGMKDTYFHLPKEKANRLIALSIKNKCGSYGNVHTLIYEGNDADYPLKSDIYLSGGAGLVSTTADYAKFLSLFLQKGTSDGESEGTTNKTSYGKRLIGAKTLELMQTNQLADSIARPGSFQFGLGLALVTPQNKFMHAASTGTLYWGGIFNTYYWVDPKENLIGLVYTQEYDAYTEDIGFLFKNVIYSTLEH